MDMHLERLYRDSFQQEAFLRSMFNFLNFARGREVAIAVSPARPFAMPELHIGRMTGYQTKEGRFGITLHDGKEMRIDRDSVNLEEPWDTALSMAWGYASHGSSGVRTYCMTVLGIARP